MTHNPHRVPHATNFLSVAATSSNRRNDGVRQSTASLAAKRVVHTSLIDAQWDLEDTGVANELKPAVVVARAPRTSLIDTEWDSQLEARIGNQPVAPRVFVLPQQITLLDMVDLEEELDPVITYFELDGPECLFESEFDPAHPHKDDLVLAALAR